MAYRVEWQSAEGEHGYADGSEFGKMFATVEDAINYAGGYARAVAGRGGECTTVGNVSEPSWYFRARKADGYYEEVRVISR
jgi:hypothetical protein